MPLYDFSCTNCDNTDEHFFHIADCPDNPADRMLSAIIRRARGPAAFLSVADTGAGGAPLRGVEAEREGEGARVTVTRADGTTLVLSI